MERLWVEPRLRGFVVLPDRRNPPASVGRLIPYAESPQLGGRQEVQLRDTSISASKIGRRAIERDFRRRVREGLVHHEFETPWRGLRWASLVCVIVVVALVGLAAVLFAVGAPRPGAPLGLPMLVLFWAVMFSPASRVNVRSTRLEGDDVTAVLRTGESIRRRRTEIERVRVWPFAASVRFVGGPTLWVPFDKPQHRRVLWALRHPHQYARTAIERREMRAMARRCLLVYFPLAALPFAIVCAVTQMPMFGLPASSPLIGPVAGAMMYCVLSLHAVFLWLILRVDTACARWVHRRDRRRRLRDRGPRPPQPSQHARLAHG